ncbi:MAG: hypothetical protein HZC29_08995 [Thaumarchaeota archaeon]|nr:hypothetical protein [Nitrososphaerota archaeon]
MAKLDTKHAKMFLILYAGATIIGLILFVDIYQNWEKDQNRSLKVITIEGILLEIVGFTILLKNEPITKIFSKRESNLRYDGIFCIITGSFLQGISVYLSL